MDLANNMLIHLLNVEDKTLLSPVDVTFLKRFYEKSIK